MTQLSIIIPAFNESQRIGATLKAIDDYALAHHLQWQLIVVDDGSADDTAEKVEAFDWHVVDAKLLINPVNRGKGFSVRRGMLAAEGEMRLMFDADSSTPIDQIERLQPWIEHGYAVAIGSREMADSELDPPQGRLRRLLGTCFRVYRSAFMLRQLRDTQCGFKLFTARAAQELFSRQQNNGFAFDVEVLALAEELGYKTKEVGVKWRNSKPSRVNSFSDGLRMAVETIPIWWRVRRLNS